MVLRLAVEDVVGITGCQVGSLPDLSLKTALVCAFNFISEHSLVTFFVRMVVMEVFGQSILDIFVLNVGLVTLLDSVGSGLAILPVVDGLDVVGLALRTGGGVVGTTVGVTAAWEPRGRRQPSSLKMQPVRSTYQESLGGDPALLDDPAIHLQSAQLFCQDLLELLSQDGIWSGRKEPNSVGRAVPACF